MHCVSVAQKTVQKCSEKTDSSEELKQRRTGTRANSFFQHNIIGLNCMGKVICLESFDQQTQHPNLCLKPLWMLSIMAPRAVGDGGATAVAQTEFLLSLTFHPVSPVSLLTKAICFTLFAS